MLPFLRHGESVFLVRTRFRWNRLTISRGRTTPKTGSGSTGLMSTSY